MVTCFGHPQMTPTSIASLLCTRYCAKLPSHSSSTISERLQKHPFQGVVGFCQMHVFKRIFKYASCWGLLCSSMEGDLHILTTNWGQVTVISHDSMRSQLYSELSLSSELWSTNMIKSQTTPHGRDRTFSIFKPQIQSSLIEI